MRRHFESFRVEDKRFNKLLGRIQREYAETGHTVAVKLSEITSASCDGEGIQQENLLCDLCRDLRDMPEKIHVIIDDNSVFDYNTITELGRLCGMDVSDALRSMGYIHAR